MIKSSGPLGGLNINSPGPGIFKIYITIAENSILFEEGKYKFLI